MNDVPLSAADHARPIADHHREAATLLREAGAVIVDFNGTLSLDEDLLEHCYRSALDTIGLPPMADAEYAALLGRSEHDIARALLDARSPVSSAAPSTAVAGRPPGRSGSEGGRSVSTAALLAEVAGAYVEECGRRPRIPASHLGLIRDLHALGVPLAIATGTLREMIDPVLTQVGLSELITTVVTIEDVTRGKPDPEGFLRAAELLGVDIARAVVVEDSRSGVTAAHAAGATVIGVGPSAHGADVAIDHLGQLTNPVRSAPST